MALNDRQGLEAALADINDLIRLVLSQIASTENSRVFTAAEKAPRLAALRAELAGYRAQQAALTQALNQLSLNNQRNTASAADITAQGQVARDDGANPKAPAPPAQTVTGADGRVVTKGFVAPTNATKPATTATGDTDRGTNAQLRTVAQTQAAVTSASAAGAASAQPANPQLVRVRNEETGEVYRIESDQVNRVEVNGVGSRGDDAAQPTAPANAVINRLDELYAGSQNAIVNQDNILDQFASYTYSLSWYLLDNATYNSLAASDTKFISSYYLLMQSGGAPATTADAKGAETGRSPFFSLDYYMDNFVIESSVSGTPGARGAAKLTSISFTVSEPNGISLQPNLIRAVNNLYEKNGYVKPGTAVNYVEANYVMVVRFYGYDSAGNLVMPIDKRTGATDQQAAIEKFIPFRITDIQFKVANKLVEYNITGVPTDELTAFSTDCGSIPQNFQFQGKTVSDILVGTQQQVSAERLAQENLRVSLGFDARADAEARQITGGANATSAPPPKISAAPNRVGNIEATGLCAALNLFYAEEARKRGGIADVYELQFLDPILTNASIVPPGGVDKAFAGGNPNANAASNKDPKRQNFNPAIRVRSTTAGQQIVQFIDEVMRSSSYISDQQRAVWQIDPKTGKYDWMFRGKTAQSFAWFDISCQAQVIGYDTNARRNAYRLIYKVSPYQTTMVATSEYFNPSAYRGVHKVYNYWFTGQNTQVTSHEQSFNNLWRQTISSNSSKLTSPSTAETIRNAVSSRITYSKRFMPASNQTREGADGNVYEAAANAADMLYTTDLANITLQVIGDPAWIASPRRPQPGKFDFGPFLSDGTINYSAGVPYFEFAWNRPVDYNLETGLMDVGQNNFRTNFVDTTGGLAQESVVYMATNVKSMFNRGKFTQELKGAWLFDGIKPTIPTSGQFAADARADDEARRITQGTGADLPTNAGAEKTALASVTNQYPVSPSVQLLGSNITANTIAGPLPARPPEESALNFVPPAKLPSGGFGSGSNNPSLAQDSVALAVANSGPPQLISKDA
jgi:hypothetical protein